MTKNRPTRRRIRRPRRRHAGERRVSRRDNPAGADNGKKVLIGARVSKAFHRRIETELVRRETSLQDLLVTALTVYFGMPVGFGAEIQYSPDDPKYTQEHADERNAWTDLWDRYTSQMPREKVQIMIHAMQWDLKMKKSSRRKSSSSIGTSRKEAAK